MSAEQVLPATDGFPWTMSTPDSADSTEQIPGPDDVAAGLKRAGLSLAHARAERILAMVSGGPDSAFLLWALIRLGIPVVAFHLDHQLRQDSARDAESAERLAKALSVPIEVVRERPAVSEGQAFETKARELRYARAAEAALKLGCSYIATGHTADDRVETFFLNMARGAGLDGLKSIPRRNGRILRPMLDLWKSDVRERCRAEGLPFVDDPSNLDIRIPRNKIRHHILPYLERELEPDLRRILVRQMDLLADDADYLNSVASEVFEKGFHPLAGGDAFVAPAEWFLSLHAAIARRQLRLAFERLRDADRGYKTPTSALIEVASSILARGGSADLGSGVVAAREGKKVVIKKSSIRVPPPISGELPGTIEAEPFHVVIEGSLVEDLDDFRRQSSSSVVFVKRSLAGRVVLRSPIPGERFRPFGLGGSKPLADFLDDQGLCATERLFAPVLAKEDGTIIWVVNHRISEEAALMPGERVALRLEARPLGPPTP